MQVHMVHCNVVKREVGLIHLFFLLLMVMSNSGANAQSCMPTVTDPIVVNGVVVGTAIAGGGLPPACLIDAGWGGVTSRSFTPLCESPPCATGTLSASIFLAGYNATSDPTLDNIYIGIHVESDAAFSNQDYVTLYFDDGDDSWGSGDFALQYAIGPPTAFTYPANEGEDCNADPVLTYYNYSTGWTPELTVPAGITSKTSYDYDDGSDAETEIWELEIGLDVASLSLDAPSSGTGFQLGAKLYLHQIIGGDSYTVWVWPSDLTTDYYAWEYEPSYGSVDPTDLEEPSTGDCGDVAFWPDGTTGVTATDAYGNSNAFTRWDTQAAFEADFSAGNRNTFTATALFFNPSDMFDGSTVAVPNEGTVKFVIKPYNGGFLGEYTMDEPTMSFTALGTTDDVTIEWPLTWADYLVAKDDLDVSGHSCLKVTLNGFTVNLNEATDAVSRNLTYISTSTFRDTFLVSARGFKPPSGEKSFQYIMRVKWQNIPPAYSEGWIYALDNADAIGLVDMGNGYYSMSLNLREEKHVAISISGGTMPVTPQQFLLSPRAGGKLLPNPSGEEPLEIAVKSGKMVTVIASGLIMLDPQNEKGRKNGPNGFSNARWSRSRFLLPSGYYKPWQNIGALVGSFDGFKTSFVIGPDKTFLVPDGASRLSLAVNDTSGAYDNNDGKGFTLNVIITEPLFLPTRLAAPGNAAFGVPALPQAGSNMPGLDIDVFQAVDYVEPDTVKLLNQTGYVAYRVYATHAEEIVPGVCACGQAMGKGLGVSALMMVFGLAFIWRRAQRRTTVGKF